MMNISIIRDGKTILDKNITKHDVINATTTISLFLLIFIIIPEIGVDNNLLFEKSVRAVRWQ